jgi:hypothetical protein
MTNICQYSCRVGSIFKLQKLHQLLINRSVFVFYQGRLWGLLAAFFVPLSCSSIRVPVRLTFLPFVLCYSIADILLDHVLCVTVAVQSCGSTRVLHARSIHYFGGSHNIGSVVRSIKDNACGYASPAPQFGGVSAVEFSLAVLVSRDTSQPLGQILGKHNFQFPLVAKIEHVPVLVEWV